MSSLKKTTRHSFALNLSSKQVGRILLCEPFDAALKLSCIPDRRSDSHSNAQCNARFTTAGEADLCHVRSKTVLG